MIDSYREIIANHIYTFQENKIECRVTEQLSPLRGIFFLKQQRYTLVETYAQIVFFKKNTYFYSKTPANGPF